MLNVRTWITAFGMLLASSVVCGALYTGAVTAVSQVIFPFQANGSMVEGSDGKQYCLLLGQDFSDDAHLWGRMQNPTAATFADDQGNPQIWSGPSNASPASDEFAEAVRKRVAAVRAAHPDHANDPIPSDLVTCSGSGLDPHISPAAASYQVNRLVKATGKSQEEVRGIIAACTEGPQLGILGEPRVNVVKVNLMLDGILS